MEIETNVIWPTSTEQNFMVCENQHFALFNYILFTKLLLCKVSHFIAIWESWNVLMNSRDYLKYRLFLLNYLLRAGCQITFFLVHSSFCSIMAVPPIEQDQNSLSEWSPLQKHTMAKLMSVVIGASHFYSTQLWWKNLSGWRYCHYRLLSFIWLTNKCIKLNVICCPRISKVLNVILCPHFFYISNLVKRSL